jgi:orotidine-5'-phosphate decarboxylase
MNAIEKLKGKTNKGYHICIGLDTDINKIPKHLLSYEDPVFEFNKRIIDATSGSVAAYKINFAFYETSGSKGFESLKKTIELLPDDVLKIGDAKRGDIGNTSQMYASSVFNHFGFDSVTLHPYMGSDSLKPFLDYKDKLNFILVLTSNPGAADFEKQKLEDGTYLFQKVISTAAGWSVNGNCGFVFGATKIEELKENIKLFNGMPVLLPGVGAQGGSLEETARIFESNKHNSYLINISRALIYCDSTENFEAFVKSTLDDYNKKIAEIKISL